MRFQGESSGETERAMPCRSVLLMAGWRVRGSVRQARAGRRDWRMGVVGMVRRPRLDPGQIGFRYGRCRFGRGLDVVAGKCRESQTAHLRASGEVGERAEHREHHEHPPPAGQLVGGYWGSRGTHWAGAYRSLPVRMSWAAWACPSHPGGVRVEGLRLFLWPGQARTTREIRVHAGLLQAVAARSPGWCGVRRNWSSGQGDAAGNAVRSFTVAVGRPHAARPRARVADVAPVQ